MINLKFCNKGKTDVAMLTILHAVSQHANLVTASHGKLSLTSNDFKIVYVAPMKALAAEIVRKLSKRLAWIGLQVRELTGKPSRVKSQNCSDQIS